MVISIMIISVFGISQTSFANESTMVEYKIIYEVTNYSPYSYRDVTLHYGVNGWNDVKDTKMNFKRDQDKIWCEAIIKVNKNDVVDYCFRNFYTETRQEIWDNNNGQDYHVQVIDTNL